MLAVIGGFVGMMLEWSAKDLARLLQKLVDNWLSTREYLKYHTL